ncbi:MAG TPA: class E sortase [Ilumatobacteraceae bacterium]|nr:class E sortase [Ilumatobacteraceae bacterium]
MWSADETFDGWAHCTVGKDQPPCPCWREWPRLPAASTTQPGAAASDDHDWRRVVRTVGKVLIATGLLLAGFVAYQLWGTGIEARRAQTALEDEFEALLTSVATSTSTSTSPATSTTVPPGTTPATVLETEPTTAPDTVPATAAPPTIAPIAEGDPVARLEIPEIDLDVVVVAGVSVADLRKGPGHYPDTPLPGQYGNAAIAGHRTTYGQPFHDVDDLEPGDEIIVTTLAGRFVYEVTGTEIVDDSATHVVATTNPDIAELTLTSCHPKWSASQRIIVHSVLVADESAPVTYAPGAAPTTTTTTTTTVSSTTTIASTASTASTVTTVPTTTSTIASVAPDEPVTPSSGDAFSDGWFHDGSAIPQVALWALVLSAIAVGAHVLSRTVHSRLLGIAAGIFPFLIALYFFYQNVNRLLPPTL